MPTQDGPSRFRIAVASSDRKYVHLHFGRTTQFQIFDVEGSRLDFVECREVPALCEGGNHDLGQLIRVIGKLRDCQAVLAAQIGPGVQKALSRFGIHPFVFPDTIPSAVKKLRNTGFPSVHTDAFH